MSPWYTLWWRTLRQTCIDYITLQSIKACLEWNSETETLRERERGGGKEGGRERASERARARALAFSGSWEWGFSSGPGQHTSKTYELLLTKQTYKSADRQTSQQEKNIKDYIEIQPVTTRNNEGHRIIKNSDMRSMADVWRKEII
jgi:hypothetical protein